MEIKTLRLRKTRGIILPLAFILLSGTMSHGRLGAQDMEELYSRYSAAADFYMPLLRCRLSTGYEYPFNGAYTWDIDGFQEGTISFEGKVYGGVLLDIDAHTQEVMLRNENLFFSMTPPRKSVRFFTRGARKWVNLHDWGYPNAPEGFFEELYVLGDERLFDRVDRTAKQDVNVREDFLGPFTKPFNPETTSYFEYTRHLYLLTADGQMHRIRNRRAFLRLHRSRSKEIRLHMKPMDKLPLDAWTIEALKYLSNTPGHETQK